MITLIYGSTASKPMSDEELVDLLKKSHEKNKRLEITGMLLYDDGNFVQVVEGPKEAVESLYQSIQHDPRHQNVMLFVKRDIEARQFGDWEMGFVNVGKLDMENVPGYTRFLQDPEHLSKLEDASYAYAFLSVFRNNIR